MTAPKLRRINRGTVHVVTNDAPICGAAWSKSEPVVAGDGPICYRCGRVVEGLYADIASTATAYVELLAAKSGAGGGAS